MTNTEKVSHVIASLVNGSWLEKLSEEHDKIVQSWFIEMEIGYPHRPYLIITLNMDDESILPVIVYECEINEEDDRVKVILPGRVQWLDTSDSFPIEYQEQPMLDISTIAALADFKKKSL